MPETVKTLFHARRTATIAVTLQVPLLSVKACRRFSQEKKGRFRDFQRPAILLNSNSQNPAADCCPVFATSQNSTATDALKIRGKPFGQMAEKIHKIN